MPGNLRSPDLARKAKERIPDIAVLFTSGYTDNAIVHGGKLDPGVHLLSKPYSHEALARKLRHIIEDERERGAARRAESTPRHGSSDKPSDRNLRVLLVEDDVLIRMVAVDMLQSLGHEVSEAGNATDALVKRKKTKRKLR